MSSPIGSETISGLSIHQLNRGKPFETEASVKLFIDRILTKVNQDKEEPLYNEVILSHWKIEEHQQFQAKLYFARRKIRNKFSKWVATMSNQDASDFEQLQTDFILFLFREHRSLTVAKDKTNKIWELFALTANEGGRAVKPFADYRFPMRVALRIVSAKLSIAQKKPLTGDKDSSVDIYRGDYSLINNEKDTIWQWFKGFTSYFKPGCSIYNPEYQLTPITLVHDVEVQISVELTAGKLLVRKPMTMPYYELFINHFSRIAADEETFYIDPEDKKAKEETDDPGILYLDNICLVDPHTVPILDQNLLKRLWKFFNEETSAGGFYFSHRLNQFFRAGSYTLRYKFTDIEWNARPSLRQVVEALRYLYGKLTTFESFSDALQRTSFKFDEKSQYFSIKEFICGDLRYEDSIYFRVDELWLQVKADQLIVMHRAFYNLLLECLLPDSSLLPVPWIAKLEWSSFTRSHMINTAKVTQDVSDRAIEALAGEKFAFVDVNGLILNAHPNRSILENLRSKKLLNKRWEFLLEKIKARSEVQQPLTQKDLEEVLHEEDKEKRKIPTPQLAQELLAVLKEERPVLIPLSEGKLQMASLLDENKVARAPEVTGFLKLTEAAEAHKLAINNLLKASQDQNTALTENDFKEIKTGKTKINSRTAQALWKELQLPKRTAVPVKLPTDKFLMQGPLPANANLQNGALNGYLQTRFQEIQYVGPEEHFNRKFLDLQGYIVGDQISPNRAEIIELFDIMHYGDKEQTTPLSLIHVKEGFGQSTREACAQIRISASIIAAALNHKTTIIRDFYNIVIKGGSSPFRQKLKQKVEADFPTEESFIDLFHTKRQQQQIQYVYAFIDEGEPERLLALEKDPSLAITINELVPFVADAAEADNLLATLKTGHILDQNGKIEAAFLRMAKDEFLSKVRGMIRCQEILNFLWGRCSQFDSLGAKIELLDLKSFLDNLKIGFKICQVKRSGTSLTTTNTAQGWHTVDSKDWKLPIPKVRQPAFQFDGKSFGIEPHHSTDVELLERLLNASVGNAGLALYQLLQESKAHAPAAAFTQKTKPLTLLSMQPFSEEHWKLAAELKQTKLVIFNCDAKEVVQTAAPLISTPNGGSTVYLVKNSQGYQIAHPIIPDEDELIDINSQPNKYTLSGVLSDTDKSELLADASRTGIVNGSTHCFFNALLQIILNSEFLSSFFMDKSNRKNELGPAKSKQEKFFLFWEDLVFRYHLSAICKTALTYDRDLMRDLLNFDRNRQQDPSEAFNRMIIHFNRIALITSAGVDIIKLDQKYEVTKKIAGQFSIPNTAGEIKIDPQLINMLTIPIPDSDTDNFDTLLNAALVHTEAVEDERKFLSIDQSGTALLCAVPSYTRKITHTIMANEFFVVVQRGKHIVIKKEEERGRVPDKEYLGTTKITSKLGINATHKVGDVTYKLKSFIHHIGNEVAGGHYITFCRIGEEWVKFDDSKTPEKFTDGKVPAEADNAYILHFVKA